MTAILRTFAAGLLLMAVALPTTTASELAIQMPNAALEPGQTIDIKAWFNEPPAEPGSDRAALEPLAWDGRELRTTINFRRPKGERLGSWTMTWVPAQGMWRGTLPQLPAGYYTAEFDCSLPGEAPRPGDRLTASRSFAVVDTGLPSHVRVSTEHFRSTFAAGEAIVCYVGAVGSEAEAGYELWLEPGQGMGGKRVQLDTARLALRGGDPVRRRVVVPAALTAGLAPGPYRLVITIGGEIDDEAPIDIVNPQSPTGYPLIYFNSPITNDIGGDDLDRVWNANVAMSGAVAGLSELEGSLPPDLGSSPGLPDPWSGSLPEASVARAERALAAGAMVGTKLGASELWSAYPPVPTHPASGSLHRARWMLHNARSRSVVPNLGPVWMDDIAVTGWRRLNMSGPPLPNGEPNMVEYQTPGNARRIMEAVYADACAYANIEVPIPDSALKLELHAGNLKVDGNDLINWAQHGAEARFKFSEYILKAWERSYGPVREAFSHNLPGVFAVHNRAGENHTWTAYKRDWSSSVGVDPAYMIDGADVAWSGEWNLDTAPRPYDIDVEAFRPALNAGVPVWRQGYAFRWHGSPQQFQREAFWLIARGFVPAAMPPHNNGEWSRGWSGKGNDQSYYAAKYRIQGLTRALSHLGATFEAYTPLKEVGVFVDEGWLPDAPLIAAWMAGYQAEAVHWYDVDHQTPLPGMRALLAWGAPNLERDTRAAGFQALVDAGTTIVVKEDDDAKAKTAAERDGFQVTQADFSTVDTRYFGAGKDGISANGKWGAKRRSAIQMVDALHTALGAPMVEKSERELFVGVAAANGAARLITVTNWATPELPQSPFRNTFKGEEGRVVPVVDELRVRTGSSIGAVYDLFTGERVAHSMDGERLVFTADCSHSEARVYLALGAPLTEIRLAAPSTASGGDRIAPLVTLIDTSGTSVTDPVPVRLALFDPDGRLVAERHLAASGATAVDPITIPRNAAEGDWRLVATSLAGSLSVEASIAVTATALDQGAHELDLRAIDGAGIHLLLQQARSKGLTVILHDFDWATDVTGERYQVVNTGLKEETTIAENLIARLAEVGITATVKRYRADSQGTLPSHRFDIGQQMPGPLPMAETHPGPTLVLGLSGNPLITRMGRSNLLGLSWQQDSQVPGTGIIAHLPAGFSLDHGTVVVTATDEAGWRRAIDGLLANVDGSHDDGTWQARNAVRLALAPAMVRERQGIAFTPAPATVANDAPHSGLQAGAHPLAPWFGTVLYEVAASEAGAVVGTAHFGLATVGTVSADGQRVTPLQRDDSIMPQEVALSPDGSRALASYRYVNPHYHDRHLAVPQGSKSGERAAQVVGFDATSGDSLWTAPTRTASGDETYNSFHSYDSGGTMGPNGDYAYLMEAGRGLVKRDLATGDLVWTIAEAAGTDLTKRGGDALPVLSADGAFVAITRPIFAVFDAEWGDEIWSAEVGGWNGTSQVLSDDGSWLAAVDRGGTLRVAQKGTLVIERSLGDLAPGTQRFSRVDYHLQRVGDRELMVHSENTSLVSVLRLNAVGGIDYGNITWQLQMPTPPIAREDKAYRQQEGDRFELVVRNGRLDKQASARTPHIKWTEWKGIEFRQIQGYWMFQWMRRPIDGLRGAITESGGELRFTTPATIAIRSGEGARVKLEEEQVAIPTTILIRKEGDSFSGTIDFDYDDILREFQVANIDGEITLNEAYRYADSPLSVERQALAPVQTTARWNLPAISADVHLLADGQTLVAGLWDGTVRAFHLPTGGELWSVDVDSGCQIASSGTMVYAASAGGIVYQIDATTGELRWSRNITNDLTAPERALASHP